MSCYTPPSSLRLQVAVVAKRLRVEVMAKRLCATVNNVASFIDPVIIPQTFSDTFIAASAGLLSIQSYVDNPTYFAEDYVGTSRTFS